MKSVVADWLKSARTDLETIDAIIGNANLTTVIALPTGTPTLEDAQTFAQFASETFEKVTRILSE
jgi:hypothetical protein